MEAKESAAPPAGYSYGPRYQASFTNIGRGIVYIARGRPRSLARDTLLALRDMPLVAMVRGEDQIPETGRFVVVANHYERPGLWMAWPAMFLSHLVAERTAKDIHWIAIEEWETFSLWGMRIPPDLIRRVFSRAFSTYGILAMPPPKGATAARARSLRTAANLLKRGEIIGLMPEGDVGATPELLRAREGVGAFLLLLASVGTIILPVGFYEENSRLVAQIGAPLELMAPTDISKSHRDQWASRHVMEAIRSLLPEPLWGAYRSPPDAQQ